MSIFLSIPVSEYEPLRLALDTSLGFPNETAPTSIIPNMRAFQDGNCYIAVPDSWTSDLVSKYVVEESVWRNAKPSLLKPKSVDPIPAS